MNKCKNCGQEFEGNFCPVCGTKAGEEGREEQKIKTVGNAGGWNIYTLTEFLPAVLIALFSVMTFLFFLAPVATAFDEGFGSLYSFDNLFLTEIPGLKGSMIASIVFAAVGVVFSIAAVLVSIRRYYRTVKLSKKLNLSVNKAVSYIGSAIIYSAILILGCVIMGQITSFDDGTGLLGVGACPILMIVFPLLFALLCAGAEIARIIIAKKHPDLKQAEIAREEEYLSLFDRYVKGLEAPVKPGLNETFAQIKEEKGWDEETAEVKFRGMGRNSTVAACGLFGFFVFYLVGACLTLMSLENKLQGIANIVGCAVVIIVSVCLLFTKKARYFISMEIYRRRLKKFEAGKNYTGLRAFEKWINVLYLNAV